MKGMSAKLNLNEIDTLKAKLNRACTENGVPDDKKDTIISKGLELFMVDASGLYTFPLDNYPNVDDYIKFHRDGAEHGIDSNLTKEQLYNRLVKAATAGNMAQYRCLRQQYSALV